MAANTRKRGGGKSSALSVSSSSPSLAGKREIKGRFVCPICDEVILDAVGSKPGDDSIQCDGVCATWLHRRCAGLSKEAFTSVSKSNDPFFCPQCRLNQQELDLKSLRDMVANLSSHITIIADELATVKQQVDELKAINQNAPSATSAVQSVSMSYASALDTAAEDGPRSKVKANASTSAYSPTPVPDLSDRKYNLLIFGLKESTKGTPRFRRESKDLSDVCNILTTVDSSISPQAVRDCFRLGKYNPNKDRPIMVKFVRSHDVVTVLSNRKNLSQSPGISIKPDRTPRQRKVESVLLKERRSLINSGVAKEDIHIKGNSLLVKKAKHGHVVGDIYQKLPVSEAGSVDQKSSGGAAFNHRIAGTAVVVASGVVPPGVNTEDGVQCGTQSPPSSSSCIDKAPLSSSSTAPGNSVRRGPLDSPALPGR